MVHSERSVWDWNHVDLNDRLIRLGSMKLIFMDSQRIHLTICYALESNQSTECAENQIEHLILKTDQQELDNDTITWLQSHCSIIDPNDFVVNDDPSMLFQMERDHRFVYSRVEKCLSNVTEPATVKLIAPEPVVPVVTSK